MNSNQKAFLEMIAHSEIGDPLLSVSDRGYNVCVGSTAAHPILFTPYTDHPRKLIKLSPTLSSTAAGRYQLLERYYDAYKKSLRLPDFSPMSQDAIAIQQITECGAMPLIQVGRFAEAVQRCARIWASLPGNSYGQHENKITDLQAAYITAGGKLA